jgi:peptide/nickel transport system substrate-binding protein
MNKKYLGSILLSLSVILTLVVPLFGLRVSAQGEVAREDTVIFDIDESEIPSPHNFNWMLPGIRRNQGAHQAMWEPLFILNYETGEIQPWLGTSFTPNETLDVWTLTLRDGIKWSDGEAFNADDVVFTVNLLLGDETATLGEAANTQQWVASVEKIDDLTVQFNLKAPNPRYQLDYWSVRIWGGPIILPEHIWKDQDPFTFTFYDPDKGWPIGTGPYKLVSANPTEFVWDRDDNWWGAETGWMPLPEPKRLIWIIAPAEETKALLMADSQLDSAMNITLGAFEAILEQCHRVVFRPALRLGRSVPAPAFVQYGASPMGQCQSAQGRQPDRQSQPDRRNQLRGHLDSVQDDVRPVRRHEPLHRCHCRCRDGDRSGGPS